MTEEKLEERADILRRGSNRVNFGAGAACVGSQPRIHYTHLFASHRSVTAMGLTLSSIGNVLSSLTRWTKEKDVRILMLGLDSAGKVRVTVRPR